MGLGNGSECDFSLVVVVVVVLVWWWR